jgi:hypothetical protein
MALTIIESFSRKFKKWSLPTKIFVVFGFFGLVFGAFQASPQIIGTAHFFKKLIVGDPPIDAPLKQQIDSALIEMDENIDCLASYNALRDADVPWTLCKPKSKYMKSLSKQFSVMGSRDLLGESDRIHQDWMAVLKSYEKISKIRTHKHFLLFEKNSELTLRDTLFLTTFLKYFYSHYYSDARACFEIENLSKSKQCKGFADAELEQIAQYNVLTAKWNEWPARATRIEGIEDVTIEDWLGSMD